ncbi:T6SS effector amidase Tae4 family protein [Prosthecomicrobium sp. N25]|uniref:T6SS effector amidase Tae4 family protein n=1 Tax=Prosthecomicrobium sp. N25 TaxID=3129254 RepID=UPI003076D3E8
MAFARIPLDFSAMVKGYVYHTDEGQIKDWVTEQNKREDKINEENKERKAQNLPPLPGGGHSTTCCMQVSASFNSTNHRIPSQGTVDRDNTALRTPGLYYILTVKEFRNYLVWKYGPTDTLEDVAEAKVDERGERVPASIRGRQGVILFGNEHIELWDRTHVLQHTKSKAAMNHFWMWKQRPIWFWQVGDSVVDAVEEAGENDKVGTAWLVGWWTVYDGEYYYYYFHPNGQVNYIKHVPNKKWVPKPETGNRGRYAFTMKDITLHIVWNKLEPGEPATEEDFTRVGWTSTTEMNGTSNKYSPLFARKLV